MMRRLRVALGVFVPLLALAGCVAETRGVYAPDAEVQKYAYVSGDAPQIALVTNISNRNGKGAHSALIIDGPTRVVFNPAGTWSHPAAPEQGDLHHGFTPAMEAWFIDYHARETYRVNIQRLDVPPEVAAEAWARAKATGTVTGSGCTLSIGRILKGLPGFEEFPVSLFPDNARKAFAKIDGVESTTYVDDSPGDRSDLRAGMERESNVQVVPEQNIARTAPRTGASAQ